MYQDNDTSNHLKQYNISGNLLNTWNVPTGYYETNNICVDNDNNIYINYGTSIVKRNSNGEIVLTKTGISNSEAIAIGTDGYIYSRESFGDDVLVRRNTSDLDSVDYIALYNKNLYGLVLDSDGYIYMCNASDSVMEKWQYSDYGRLLTKAIGTAGAEDSGLCIASSLMGMAAGFQGAFSMNKALSQGEIVFGLGCSFIHETPSSINDNFLFVGDLWEDTHLVLKKYNSSKVLVWAVDVLEPGSNAVDSAAVAAYPF